MAGTRSNNMKIKSNIKDYEVVFVENNPKALIRGCVVLIKN